MSMMEEEERERERYRENEYLKLTKEEETYVFFEVCPACDKERLRVQFKVLHRDRLSVWSWLPVWYSYDLRCLNCGYFNSFRDDDPFYSEEEVLEEFLKSEREPIGVARKAMLCVSLRERTIKGKAVEKGQLSLSLFS